jgi:hypothetical protein
MKRAAAGRFRGSEAHPAACWEQDTIPKPDGLATTFSGAASNGNRTQLVPCSGLSGSCSGFVRHLSGVREADHDAGLFSRKVSMAAWISLTPPVGAGHLEDFFGASRSKD